MALHNTQCPHCFTDYVISDSQYRASEGMVRCGTCREPFKARLMDESLETPKFDPRDAFIEPLSVPKNDSSEIEIEFSEPEPSYRTYEKPVDPNEEKFELMSTHEFDYVEPDSNQSESLPQDVIDEIIDSDELSTSEILANLRARNGAGDQEDISSEHFGNFENQLESKTIDTEPSETTLRNSAEESSEAIGIIKASTQLDLQLPDETERNPADLETERTPPSLGDESTKNDILIDQVDRLIEKKLVQPVQTQNKKSNGRSKTRIEPTSNSSTDDLFLERKSSRKKRRLGFAGLFMGLFGFIICLLLLGLLAYQAWLKQWFELPQEQRVLEQLNLVTEPYQEKAEDFLARYGLSIPQRTNLSQLELLSAQTEPHPTRATTILLKVAIINRAEIAQPLPWLEMTLTDSEGRLIARRNLSPKDYIYNNQTSSLIGANELKKVTIELLSFPKAVTGYEIKLLRR